MYKHGFFQTFVFSVLLLTSFTAVAMTDTIHIVAGRDSTLIEDPNGALANGSGPVLFVGRTGQPQNSIRRGVLYFDVASAIPQGARIKSVRLILSLSRGNGGPREVRVHRLLEGWGEGASYATGGSGAPAADGDATWLHTFYPGQFWSQGRTGGYFVEEASAQRDIDNAPRSYTWESTKQLIEDVKLWLEYPQQNFGWILIGDESESQTGKRFSSREPLCDPLSPELAPPLLEVTYNVPKQS